MKVLTVSNQKGGVGKTTTVIQLAQFYAYKYGVKVAVLDLDTQANASWSLEKNIVTQVSRVLMQDCSSINLELKTNLSVFSADQFIANIDQLSIENLIKNFEIFKSKLIANQVELLIIDTPPSLNKSLTMSLLVSDFVICPIELETYSLQGIQKLFSVISNLKKYNSKLEVIGLLPSKVDNRNHLHRERLKAFKEQFNNLVLNIAITSRCGLQEALSNRQNIWDLKKASARRSSAEFSILAELVKSKMNLEA